MNCEQVKELLSAYLDNALAPEERRSVATHLEACPECSEMLADFRRFDALLSRMPRINPDASLRERIFSSQEYLDQVVVVISAHLLYHRSLEISIQLRQM